MSGAAAHVPIGSSTRTRFARVAHEKHGLPLALVNRGHRSAMTHRDWSRLTRAEVSRFGHATIGAALEREGFAVSESDDRGITDLIATRAGQRLEVTVRTLRSLTYTYVEKHRFDLRADRCVALVLLLAEREPLAFLIPAQAWCSPDAMLVSRDYDHAASRPEWGINVSRPNLALLERYALRTGNHEQ